MATSSLSTNLKILMQKKHCSAAELSRQTGVPPQTLNRLLNDKTDDPRASTLKSIAHFFNITIDELLDSRIKNPTSASDTVVAEDGFIPFYEDKPEEHLLENITPSQWLPVESYINSQQSFAVKNQGEAMFPRFLDGIILIVDRSKKPKTNDFVYVYLTFKKQCICRQWIEDNGEVCLMPVNPGFSPLKFNPASDQLLGVVVQMKSFL